MVRSENKTKQNDGNIVGLGVVVKKGPWTPEEDRKLLSYIKQFGHGSWRALPVNAGNHVLAIRLVTWSTIAAHLSRRTDNEIKNFWNSHIKKRMTKMGIDPMTHKPKSGTQLLGSNLNHMAQWEAARLEAEARLVQKPKNHSTQLGHVVSPSSIYKTPTKLPPPYLPCLDVLKVWQGNLWSNYSIKNESDLKPLISPINVSVTTPTMPILNQVETNGSCDQGPTIKHNDQIQTQMGLFEEFKYVNDENFINGNPLRSPDFWEELVNLDGDWNSVTNNFDMMYSPPASPVC
ncbi:hypothetical protein L1987_79395 [Smallanthus sonchifolius]|uniref:Uncharacterized protein n=1 Tax=Smallanthus sonchifolius TaxID=185202 RepID=A0ACB8ZF72_9ASTR|nr:hypothetical protein L1987_79395 [Smallanthus sonchifolius]